MTTHPNTIQEMLDMVPHLPILQEDFPFFIQSLEGDSTVETP